MSCELQLILNAFTLMKETSSRLEKDKIMKGLLKDKKAEKMLREILVYTFHPYYNYWVKVTKLPISDSYEDIKNRDWEYCKHLLDKLRNREVTGDAARSKLQSIFLGISKKAIPWLVQIINRDIKIGFQLKSFEKHLGELVPKCSPMLAKTWDENEIEEEIAIEEKFDGLRCHLIFPEEGEPTSISRNGRPIYNTEVIFKELKILHGSGWVIDGELRGIGESWGSSVSGAHSKNKKVDGLQFIAFDIIDIEGWEKRKCKQTLEERRSKLQHAVPGTSHVTISPAIVGNYSARQIKKIAKSFIEKGSEGIIIKPVDGTYDFKRSENWLKYKFKDTVDCKVVGRTKGKVGTRVEKLIGAIIVEGEIDGQKFRSEVGQGLKDKDRKYFSKLSDSELKRHIVEVEHYGLTGSLRLKHSDKLPAIRNGVFLRVREDKMMR